MTLRRLTANGPTRLLVVVAAIGLTGCSSTTATGAPTAAASAPASADVTTPTAGPSGPADSATAAADSPTPDSAGATAVPTSIDPCQLVTQAEVSALLGSSVGPGKLSTANETKICAYGHEGVVFEVLVAVAPDAATAKQQEPEFKKELEDGAAQAGLSDMKLTEMPNFEPGVDAAEISGSASAGGLTVKGIALYALKGAVFVALSDIAIGGSVATSAAMQAQARTTLGRLP